MFVTEDWFIPGLILVIKASAYLSAASLSCIMLQNGLIPIAIWLLNKLECFSLKSNSNLVQYLRAKPVPAYVVYLFGVLH